MPQPAVCLCLCLDESLTYEMVQILTGANPFSIKQQPNKNWLKIRKGTYEEVRDQGISSEQNRSRQPLEKGPDSQAVGFALKIS